MKRANAMNWSVMSVAIAVVMISATTHSSVAQDKSEHFVDVQICGLLQTGIMAIGGETTGTLISAGDINWELELRGAEQVPEDLEKLNGKTVYVSGRLTVKNGVERGPRWIVKVRRLDAENFFGNSDDEPAAAELAERLVIKKAQGGFAGFSGDLITIEKDGSWKLQDFLNDEIREPKSTGKLNSQQLNRLQKLVKTNLIDLDAKTLGVQVGANPLVHTITYGDEKAELTLPPLTNALHEVEMKSFEEAVKFMELVDTVAKAIGK